MMLNGKLIIDELLIILFVFTLSLFPMEARTTSVNGQKVLVISSYSPIDQGRGKPSDCVFHRSDAGRFGSENIC